MPDPQSTPPAKPKPKPKRGWFRRALRWFGVFLLFVAVFHRPLFHYGVRLIAIQLAAHQHLKLDLHLSGSIFTNLTVSGIQVSPTGQVPSPVRRIDIAHLRLDYSFPNLVRHGVGEFLRSYELVDAALELEALPSKSEPEKNEKKTIAQTLNNILGQPAFYADRVHIQNFNISVHSESAVTQVKNFNLELHPEQPGELRVERLQIPGVPVWTNLQAETSYAARNFFIRRLELSPELVIEEFNFDASQRSQNKGSMQLKARLFGGSLVFVLAGKELNKKGENLEKSYDTSLKLDVSDVSLEAASAYFGAPKPPAAKLSNLSLQFTGEPEKPRTWKGSVVAEVDAIAIDKTTIDSAGLTLIVDSGRGELKAGKIAAGKNSISFSAQLGLPESVNDFPSSDADASLEIAAPDLPALTAMMPEPLTGALAGGGPIHLHGGKVNADLAIDAKQLATGDIQVAAAKIHFVASKRLVPAPPTPLDELDGHVTANVTDLRIKNFALDSVNLDVQNHNALVTLTALDAQRLGNGVTAHGIYRVPRDFKDAAKAPVDAKFTIQGPKLEVFGIVANGHTLSGHIEGQGKVKMAGTMMEGAIRITGGDFRLGEFQTGPLSLGVKIANDLATIEEFSLKLRGSDQISITGNAGVQAPFPYNAALLIDIANLSGLQPLLGAFNVKPAVAGALHIDWTGNGTPTISAGVSNPTATSGLSLEHQGRLVLSLTKGKVDKIDLSEIKISGQYAPDFADIKEIRFVSGPTIFTSELVLQSERLTLSAIHVQQAGAPVLAGEIAVPVDLQNPKQPVPFDQPISAKITADKLDIEKLMKSIGQTPPVNGIVTASLTAEGTIQDPTAELKIAGHMLKAKAVSQLSPAEFDFDLKYGMKQLTLQAGLRQPQIQPLTIRGKAPLDIEEVIKQGRLDPKLPIEASVQLPATSLAIVPKFTPLVRRIDGTAALDVRVGGTVEKPVLSGSAAIELKQARMTDENIPSLDSFHAKLSFAGDTLAFTAFEGGLGGGKFKLGGNIKLASLTNPVFDLRLESKEVLVKRDDSITVRADTDIKLAGPLNAASASGSIYITHSRFFKEIDILPISLPGKSKPAPRAVKGGDVSISFPNPPLRDWKFDLAIKTRPDDPFVVRGNLANGKAEINLHLGGTGLAPTFEGNVHIAEFNATLPFSTLRVSRGFVYFTKDAPFRPSLDLQADSQIRDYLIHAFIYGTATDPQVTLTSEPPLQYSDIVALLATGSTTSEIGNNADVLASRAAVLAIQQLYRKTFHKGEPSPEEKKPGNNLRDRFQFEVGALDSRTGEQQVTSKLKLTDNLYLLGGLGIAGDFTGSLKYLIRFR